MEERATFSARLAGFFKGGGRKTQVIFFLGLAGILLIFFSQFSGSEKKKSISEPTENAAVYAEALEEELTALIGQIQGAGKTAVLVTLQNDWENLYVREEKIGQDSTQPVSGGDISERKTREEKYVLVDGADGRSALVRTRMEPVIRGVVVVCEGGEDPQTVSRILEAVTTALAIRSNKVCITKCA